MGQQPAARINEEMQEIDRVCKAHVAALNASDVQAWVALFADDGVQMPPNFPANVGQKMIRSWSEAFLQPFISPPFALSVDEVRSSGDWAFERDRYTITLTPKGGPAHRGHREVHHDLPAPAGWFLEDGAGHLE